jgi:hypothetical protein
MGGNATQELGMALEARIGAVDYRLQIPALSFASYLRLQRVLLRHPRSGSRRRFGWSSLGSLALWLGVGAALGAVLGVLTAANELVGGLWVGINGTELGWELSGTGLMLSVFLVMVLTAIGGTLCVNRMQRTLLAKVHSAAGELYGAHVLAIGERGLVLHNLARVLFVPWSAVTRVSRDQDGIFIVADHVSAFWLTESVLAALPDRAAFMACVERHMAAHPRADRRPT